MSDNQIIFTDANGVVYKQTDEPHGLFYTDEKGNLFRKAVDGLMVPMRPPRTSLEKYIEHAEKFIGHDDTDVDEYAQLLAKNTQDLHDGVITLEEYVANTPYPPVEDDHESLHPHRMMLHMRKMIEDRHPLEYAGQNNTDDTK